MSHGKHTGHFHTLLIIFSGLWFYFSFSYYDSLLPPRLFTDQGQSAFYMFSSPLEYSFSAKHFEYFSGLRPEQEHLLCNFTPSMEGCNSTPRDVVISCAAVRAKNIVLFQRTLRTTRTNATLIILMDQKAIDSMDPDTLNFTKQIDTQIILVPKPPSEGMLIKNYFAYLLKEFLRENQFNINRAIVMDLFDCLFQEDPFNTRLPKNKLHLVHENVKNIENIGTKAYIKKTFPEFILDNVTGNMETINAGYVGGPVSLVIGYFAQQLTLLTFSSGDDQGSTNILYITGMFEKKCIPIAEDDYNGKIRHLSYYFTKLPFPKVNGHINESVRAAVLHLYYNLPTKFVLSLLRVCPRITSNMKDYLPMKQKQNISYYEMLMANETL